MEKKILSLEKHIEFLYEELEMKEKEIDEFKKSSDDAKDSCRRMSTSRKNDLEDIDDLKKLVEEQKVKIFCLRKHRDEILDRHEKVIDDYEKEFKAKENDIKHYQEVCLKQNKEISDDKEEISTKSLEIEELDKLLEKEKELKVYSNSISEELNIAGLKMEKTKLEQENLELKTKVEKLQESKKAHADEYLKLDEIFVNMKNEVKILNQRLNRIEGKKKCSLKWNCNRLFCTFDHSFLYRKVNLKTSDHFKCDGRGKMCSRNCQLKEHEEIQTEEVKVKDPCLQGKSVVCEKCGFKMNIKSQLELHMRIKHIEVASFACESCAFQSSTKGKLEEHIKKQHMVPCTKCKRTFATVQAREEHKKTHTVQQTSSVNKSKTKTSKKKEAEPIALEAAQNLKDMKSFEDEEIETGEESLESSCIVNSVESSSISTNVSSSEESSESGEVGDDSETGEMS